MNYMDLKYLKIEEINRIKELFAQKPESVVAFPTDTVWGVGCLPNSQNGVERIYSLKGREAEKPLILLSSDIEHLKPFVDSIAPKAMDLINKHLPGALTVIIKKSAFTPDFMTSGFDSVGIRIPNHPVFCEFLEYCVPGSVLATTSANLSGEASGTNKEEVVASVGQDTDYILDDFGISAEGHASTVVLVQDDGNIKVLRQGSVIVE